MRRPFSVSSTRLLGTAGWLLAFVGCAASGEPGSGASLGANQPGSTGSGGTGTSSGGTSGGGTAAAAGTGGADATGGTDSGGWPTGPGGSGAGEGGSGNGGWGKSSFGSACVEDDDCVSGQCTDVGQNSPYMVCTEVCTHCPERGYCVIHESKGEICIPSRDNQCRACAGHGDCKNLGDQCVQSPLLDKFCARDCSVDAACPAGFECAAPDAYDPGAEPLGLGTQTGVCVPRGEESCACDEKRDAVQRLCTMDFSGDVCEGLETCDARSGTWTGCSAMAPSTEVCDGVDNDCNGSPDDGTGADLCAHKGSLSNGDWECDAGQCVVGNCEDGWTFYPPTLPPSAGCPCPVEITEKVGGVRNDTCANAVFVGATSDTSTNPVIIRGRLTSDTDVDWYSFEMIDTPQSNTNSYHVAINFAQPANNEEFRFRIIRGVNCGIPDAAHSGLTSYDWCVNGDSGSLGEAPCSATGKKHCGNHSRLYYLGVYRKEGATGSCSEYVISARADGGACDFGASCDPQQNEL